MDKIVVATKDTLKWLDSKRYAKLRALDPPAATLVKGVMEIQAELSFTAGILWAIGWIEEHSYCDDFAHGLLRELRDSKDESRD